MMNLIMFDIDGTLTHTFEHDLEIFEISIAEVLKYPLFKMDLNEYIDKTSVGVTEEAIRKFKGRDPKTSEVLKVKNKVLKNLRKTYRESSQTFSEVPGASLFINQLRQLEGVRIAIATGCWHKEALFKLKASRLTITGIPLATSDDDRNRIRIMEIAAERARDFYDCSRFMHVIYVGDGLWDLHASRDLGYSFIGIGSQIQPFIEKDDFVWFQDFRESEAILSTITRLLM